MTLLSLYNTRTAVTTHERRQSQPPPYRSSSTFIAHLLVQEYPPKVQPQSSSARDKALYSHLDKVDAEAGCILIALANHDKRKDMNDLIPYSIRVIDYNQTKTTGITDSTYETLETTTPSESTSSSSSSCSDSSIGDGGAIRDAENDDPTTNEADSNGTMSIKNLIDVNNESSSSDTPTLCENTNPSVQTGQQPSLSPSTSSASLSSSSIPTTTTPSLTTQHNDGNDQSKTKSSCKPEPRTDPILLLAAAAKAIDQGELLYQGANQKRKYSNDDGGLESRSHSAQRPRYTMENQPPLDQPLQSEKSKFSHQYLSMKQNPKIMRNAMHAYISYMIYADLTSSDKLPHHQDQGNSSSYPTQSSPNSHYTTHHSAFSASSPPPTFNHHHHYPHQHSSQPHAHYDRSSSSSSSTTAPCTNPSPIHLGALNNPIAGNSSIMARPLTAFLRDNM